MIEAVLECPQPHSWIKLASAAYSAKVEILDSKMLPGGIMEHLFELQVEPSLVETLLQTIRSDKDVIDVDFMRSKGGHVYGAVSAKRCTVCKQVAQSKCFLASLVIGSSGEPQWTVLGGEKSFDDLIRGLDRESIPHKLRLMKELKKSTLLTSRQEEILLIALESGYFDFPKKVGLKELASRTGVRESSLAEIIRRGQRKVLHDYMTRRSLLRRPESTNM